MGKQQSWSMRGCKRGPLERGASSGVGRYVKARLGTTCGGLGGGGETGQDKTAASTGTASGLGAMQAGRLAQGRARSASVAWEGWGCGAGGASAVYGTERR